MSPGQFIKKYWKTFNMHPSSYEKFLIRIRRKRIAANAFNRIIKNNPTPQLLEMQKEIESKLNSGNNR